MQTLTLREIQIACLEILKEVHIFCAEHGIKYSLAYGTLIGAIRHKGFIPWDNDIDIVMPRPDYERFLTEYHSDNNELFYCGRDKEHECLIAYARVCDCKTTISLNAAWSKKKTGVWIDIFPLDAVPDDPTEFQSIYDNLYNEWKKLARYRRKYITFNSKYGLKKKVSILIKKVMVLNGLNGQHLEKAFIQKISSLEFGSTAHWSQLAVLDNGPVEYCPISDLDSYILVPFEDSEFFIMSGYENNLRKIYGEYMQLPPKEERHANQSNLVFYWK